MTADLLLDQPALSPGEVTHLERSLADVLGTDLDVVLVPSEASLALEAAAAGLGRPGTRALNVVTGPYGHQFGRWLEQAGSTVVELEAPFDRAVSPSDVDAALGAGSWDFVSVVHTEAATGVTNQLDAIADTARRHGALIVVDAVASVGAEPLDIDGWGIDVCVIGPQKALAGPFGISAATVSAPAWEMLGRRDPPLRRSSLSLLDWKTGWIDGPRTAIPVYLPVLEARALQAALDRIAAEGLEAVIERHQRAAIACRAGLVALGLRPWVASARDAAAAATLLHTADGLIPSALVAASLASCPAPVEVAPGRLGDRALRITHTGRRATLPDVVAALVALTGGLERLGPAGPGVGPPIEAARGAWAAGG
jgi:aspartate aminotransferase-like enzyme